MPTHLPDGCFPGVEYPSFSAIINEIDEKINNNTNTIAFLFYHTCGAAGPDNQKNTKGTDFQKNGDSKNISPFLLVLTKII